MQPLPDIICVSTNHWTGLPTSKQHLMSLLSRRVRVLYVDPPIDVFSALGRRRRWSKFRGLRKVANGLWVLSPLLVDNRSSRREAALRRLIRVIAGAADRLAIRRPVLWTFDPEHAVFVGTLGERLAVYQAADDPAAFSGDPAATAEGERRHIEAVDLVFAASELLTSERAWSGKARRLANAADASHFGRVLEWSGEAAPEDVLAAVRRAGPRPHDLPTDAPIVLYGGAAYEWFDEDLLAAVAERRPELRFVLVGPVCRRVASRRLPRNVLMLGRRSYDVFPRYVAAADCAVIPWRRGVFSEHADPIVLYELLLCGLPVVATPFPAARERGQLVRTADEVGAFAASLDAALERDGVREAVERIAFGLENTWEDRAQEAAYVIEALLEKREYRS
ncbi:MAG: glycosyltransferase [Candidatus Eisenbacteria bacterium]|nr:glycosyltransferase [Candidatus Eisenbacteria bacterium]